MSDLRNRQLSHLQGFEDALEQSEQAVLRNFATRLVDFEQHMGSVFTRYEDAEGQLTRAVMSRHGRQVKLDQALRGITVNLYAESTRIVTSAINASYVNGFQGTTEVVRRTWGQNSLIGILRQEELHRAATNEISGLAWTKRLNLHREAAVAHIRETIVQGIHRGESYAQMARRLNEVLGTDTVNTLRIIRTECYRVFSEAKKDRLDRVAGIDMTKEWITSKDESVRKNHKVMHGVKVPYNMNFKLPNGNEGFAPGMIGAAADDINCRCFWVVDMA